MLVRKASKRGQPERNAACTCAHLCIYCIVLYEWDKAKNRANLTKHGVDFADAVAVFEDPLALMRPDPEARGEPRFDALGVDGFGRHLIVVFTERGSSIRLVSARLATNQERKSYEG